MIGVFGGTFDPIHFGHLRPALDILQTLPIQEIRFVPLGQAVHRPQPMASPPQRLAMVRIAIRDQPGFIVDEREITRAGDSYSYDTLASLRAELGAQQPTLCLLTGLDAFNEFCTWYRWRDIPNLAHLLVLRRPGAVGPSNPELRRWLEPRRTTEPRDLVRAPAGLVYFHDVRQLDISATDIRSRIARALSPRYLLPESVLALIEREGLYRQ